MRRQKLEEARLTYVDMAMKISWRFALVMASRTTEKRKTNVKTMPIFMPGEVLKRYSSAIGSRMRAIDVKRMMALAAKTRRVLE
jgi:hypothetical protein